MHGQLPLLYEQWAAEKILRRTWRDRIQDRVANERHQPQLDVFQGKNQLWSCCNCTVHSLYACFNQLSWAYRSAVGSLNPPSSQPKRPRSLPDTHFIKTPRSHGKACWIWAEGGQGLNTTWVNTTPARHMGHSGSAVAIRSLEQGLQRGRGARAQWEGKGD